LYKSSDIDILLQTIFSPRIGNNFNRRLNVIGGEMDYGH